MAIDILITLLLMPWGGMVMMFPMLLAAPGFKDNTASLIQAFMLFFYPAAIFSIYWLLDWNYFGLTPMPVFIASFCLCYLATSLFDLRRLTVNALKHISNTGYFNKADCVYINGKKIRGCLAESFEVLSTDFPSYARDANRIYCDGIAIPGADVSSFVALKKGYAKDQFHVYLYQYAQGVKIVANENPQNFSVPEKNVSQGS